MVGVGRSSSSRLTAIGLLCLALGPGALFGRTLPEILYKSGPLTAYERETCKLDLYLPQGIDHFPVLVYLHGGNLVSGDKRDLFEWGIVERFLEAGVAVATANYRLSPRVHYPAYAEDAAAAVAWVSRNISQYGGNPNKVFVGGHSAGGTLAAMVGTNPFFYRQLGLDENKIAGYVLLSAQTATHEAIRAERGHAHYYIDEAAPQLHARALRQPFLCFTARHDPEGRSVQNDALVARLAPPYLPDSHRHSSHTVIEGRDPTALLRNMANPGDRVLTAILEMIRTHRAPLKTEIQDSTPPPLRAILPRPHRIQPAPGRFTLGPEARILADPLFASEAELLAEQLRPATGFPVRVTLETDPSQVGEGILYLRRVSPDEIPREGYVLTVHPDRIVVAASEPAGAFYGGQTLRQLLPAEIFSPTRVETTRWTIDCVRIQDQPRFGWRSYLLDEARHFQGMETVKRLLEQMALHKMNVFQWHLVDDQGWRIEIKKYPRLAGLGSRRSATQIEHHRSPKRRLVPHGGFYTQQQIRDVVAFAARRHITVVPEISMPGHAGAAIHAYPEVGTSGQPIPLPVDFGQLSHTFQVADPGTMTFLHNVLSEVMTLFPSEVIHIGGDEVRFDQWRASPATQAFMARRGLSDPAQVQLGFTNQMSRFLESRGRRMMGWNEILGHPGEGADTQGPETLAPDTIVHFWLGDPEIAVAAARRGYALVNSYHRSTYLNYDYHQLPLESVYDFDPIPENLPQSLHASILGAGSQMWGEWTPNRETVEYQTFPRLSAFAEVAWTQTARKDYRHYLRRLRIQMKRWDVQGIHYADVFDR